MIDLLINSSSRRDVNGNIMGVIGIGQDLTAMKEINRLKETTLL